MKKIKVLFTIPNFKTAGSGREMLNIVEQLDKDIFEPWVGVQETGGELFDEVIKKRIPIVVQPFMAQESDSLIVKIRKAKSLSKDFKGLGFDIWQSFNWSSDFSEAFVARWSGAKFVYVKKNMNWGRKAWKTKTMLSSAVVARNSTMLSSFFASKKYKRKVSLISGGVDIDVFKPEIDQSLRKKLNVPDTAVLGCCTAHIVRSKNIETLIKSIAKVSDAYIIIAGAIRDDAYYEELQQLTVQLNLKDRVGFVGKYDNVNALLNISNFFVLPTNKYKGHEEGCPVAVLEAMATGTPCIVSDVAGNTDLIEHEKSGLVFKADNVDSLAYSIRELISKPTHAKVLSETAIDKIYSQHTIQHEAKAFEALYKTMMKY